MAFPGGSDGKECPCNEGDPGSIPGLGRYPGGGHGNPLQYSCLENPVDRGAWWAALHRVTKRWAQLSNEHMECGMLVPGPGVEASFPALEAQS